VVSCSKEFLAWDLGSIGVNLHNIQFRKEAASIEEEARIYHSLASILLRSQNKAHQRSAMKLHFFVYSIPEKHTLPKIARRDRFI
jgi:hypothetical protein